MKHTVYCPSVDPNLDHYDPSVYIKNIVDYLDPDTDCKYLMHCVYLGVDSEWYRLAKNYQAVKDQIKALSDSNCTYEDFEFTAYPIKEGVELIDDYQAKCILEQFTKKC